MLVVSSNPNWERLAGRDGSALTVALNCGRFHAISSVDAWLVLKPAVKLTRDDLDGLPRFRFHTPPLAWLFGSDRSTASSVLSRMRKLVFLVTEDWYFVSHRMALARAAMRAGYEVHLITRVSKHEKILREEGIVLHPIGWRRRGASILSEAGAVRRIGQLYRALQPAIAHHVALKSVIYGSVAAALTNVPSVVNAITGLGYSFTASGPKPTLIRLPVLASMRILLNRPGWTTLLQNPDDRDALVGLGAVRRERSRIIRGSGVDTSHFRPLSEPESRPITIAVASRMIAIKGIADLVAASMILQRKGVQHRLLLVGQPDPDNPGSISEDQLRRWGSQPQITWCGQVNDIRNLWAEAHIAALTSRGGEGLPKSLLEAAACGRPILGTDISGTREVVRHRQTGLLVPPKNADAIAQALEKLIADGKLRARLGAAGRLLVCRELSVDAVVEQTLALYGEILS